MKKRLLKLLGLYPVGGETYPCTDSKAYIKAKGIDPRDYKQPKTKTHQVGENTLFQ